jgi:hypothetical protein
MVLPFQALALREAAPRAQAYNVVLWLQLWLGLLVPSVCLYCQEVRKVAVLHAKLGVVVLVSLN